MTLAEILAKLQAFATANPELASADADRAPELQAEAFDLLRQFNAYASNPEGAEVTTELAEAALVVRYAHDLLAERAAAEEAANEGLANAVDSVFSGLDFTLSDEDGTDDGDGGEDGVDDEGTEGEVVDDARELVTASRSIEYRRPPVSGESAPTVDPAASETPEAPNFIVASAGDPLVPATRGRPDKAFPGQAAESGLALAEAICHVGGEALTAGRSASFRGRAGDNSFIAARFPGQGHAGEITRGLDADGVADLVREAGMGHLTAGAGHEPIPYSYGYAGTAVSAATPVWDSLTRFSTTRSKFGIRLRRSLMDYEAEDPTEWPDGAGEWTLADDNDSEAAKADPASTNVTGTETFELKAFYRSFELTNLEVLTDPERVDQDLGFSGVAWTRALERDVIDELSALPGAIYLEAAAGDYGPQGSSREIVPILREMTEELEHQEGFSSLGYDLITLDWAQTAIANDLWRRNTKSYDQKSGPVRPYLLDTLNIDPVFTQVGSSGKRTGVSWLETPRLSTAGSLGGGTITFGDHNRTPSRLNFILAPKGTLGAVDRGFLQVGVAPWGDGRGSVLRDSTLASTNKFRVFWEIVKCVFSTGMPYIVGQITGLNDDGSGVADTDAVTFSS